MSLGLRSSSILTTLEASFKSKSFNELKLRAYGAKVGPTGEQRQDAGRGALVD